MRRTRSISREIIENGVQHQKMIDVLKNIGLDEKDLRIITNLYWNQSASVRLGEENTDEIRILRGVRQGCILSPLIFNLYAEQIFIWVGSGRC